MKRRKGPDLGHQRTRTTCGFTCVMFLEPALCICGKLVKWPPTHLLVDRAGRLISYLFSSEQCPYNPLLLEPEPSQLALLEGAAEISKGGGIALLTHVFQP